MTAAASHRPSFPRIGAAVRRCHIDFVVYCILTLGSGGKTDVGRSRVPKGPFRRMGRSAQEGSRPLMRIKYPCGASPGVSFHDYTACSVMLLSNILSVRWRFGLAGESAASARVKAIPVSSRLHDSMRRPSVRKAMWGRAVGTSGGSECGCRERSPASSSGAREDDPTRPSVAACQVYDHLSKQASCPQSPRVHSQTMTAYPRLSTHCA